MVLVQVNAGDWGSALNSGHDVTCVFLFRLIAGHCLIRVLHVSPLEGHFEIPSLLWKLFFECTCMNDFINIFLNAFYWLLSLPTCSALPCNISASFDYPLCGQRPALLPCMVHSDVFHGLRIFLVPHQLMLKQLLLMRDIVVPRWGGTLIRKKELRLGAFMGRHGVAVGAIRLHGGSLLVACIWGCLLFLMDESGHRLIVMMVPPLIRLHQKLWWLL